MPPSLSIRSSNGCATVHCANTALQIVQSTHTAVQFYHLRQSSLFGLWAVRDVYNVEKSQPLFRANEMFQ